MNIMYLLLYRHNGEIKCRRKEFRNVKDENEAIKLANEFVKKKKGNIHILRKIKTSFEDLIKNP